MADITLDLKAPWQAQIDFFRQKLNIPTQAWDDIRGAAHDAGFIVAGSAKADLLADFRQVIDKVIAEGKSIDWFRKEFDRIVQDHGWDYRGPRNWRTRVIYQTNLSTSYAAGRWAQLNDPDLLAIKPYWVYRHGHPLMPRELHLSWNGMALPAGHQWFIAHYPPNGFGCLCYVTAASLRQIQREGWRLLENPPDDGVYAYTDKKTGEIHELPRGVDYGWDYAPGRSYTAKLVDIQARKLEYLPWQLARANASDLVDSPIFAQFFKGDLPGEFPIAVLPPADASALEAKSPVVLLSQESLATQLARHPEIGAEDYRKAQAILEQGDAYRLGETLLVYLKLGDARYRAELERMGAAMNYFLVLFRGDEGLPPEGAERVR